MALHFEKLIVSLLVDDHCSVLNSNLFALAFSLSRVISLITRQVSSAYCFMLSLEKVSILLMSLMYSKKRRGPSIDPCGTPWLMRLRAERQSLMLTH